MSTTVKDYVVVVVIVFVIAAGAMSVMGGQVSTSVAAASQPTSSYAVASQQSHASLPVLHDTYSSWSLFTEDPSMGMTAAPQHGLEVAAFYESGLLKFDPRFFANQDNYPLKRYLVFGSGPADGESGLAAVAAGRGAAGMLGVQTGMPLVSNGGFFSISVMSEEAASELSSQGLVVIEDMPLDLHAPVSDRVDTIGATVYDDSYVSDSYAVGYSDVPVAFDSSSSSSKSDAGILSLRMLSGLDADADIYNATGAGITVAIVDTGVDFSNPDIRHSVARDPVNNHPIMLDPDGNGIVLTNSTFFANIDEDGIIWNHTGPVPDGYDSVVYVTGEGVFLDVSQKGRGTIIDVYNTLFPAAGAAPIFEGKLDNDMRIGESNRDYIRSQSGAYRLGVIYQMGAPGPASGPAGLQVVPVLTVDSFVAGTYDTVIPDMSSSWMDYSYKPGSKQPDFDFDFTDEGQIVLGSGNEFLIYDSDEDGLVDYTAGAVGARVLDVYSVTNASMSVHYDDSLQAVNGTLLPAIDPDGRFFGIMTDFDGHGTKSASTIASNGKMTYDIYNDTKKHHLKGIAPDTKILPVKALWMGDAVYGWLWSAGFENNGNSWTFTGRQRADIISNSWGVSSFPSVGFAPGSDVLALVLNMLATPRSLHDDYPGVVLISSSGNSGHGYGTMGTPGVASLGISVGASTSNVFVGYGPYKDQPRFGSNTQHHSHISDFSSRGPGPLGDPKPDLVGLGAHGFVPYPMMGASLNSSMRDPFSLFGGTSMSAPVVSGVAALVMEQMTGRLLDYDPFVIRNILMSTASNMHNDPFTQGSGLADAGTALDFVHGNGGVFVVYNDDSYAKIRDLLMPAINSANLTDTGVGDFALPEKNIPITSWFAGYLEPGGRTTATFTIENPSNDALDVVITPQVMSLLERTHYEGNTVLHQQDPVLNEAGVFVPNYIRLADVRTHEDLVGLFDDTSPFPEDTSLLVLNVNFDFADFMNATAKTYADDLGIASLYMYDWVDKNNDDIVASDELSLVTRGGSWGTVQEIRISNPTDLFDGVPMVGVYPVPARYSYWAGAIGVNATSMNYTVSASYYDREEWDSVWPGQAEVQVMPDDVYEVDVTLIVPDDVHTGAYQGFLTFEGDSHTVNVPVSYVVKEPVYDGGEFLISSAVLDDKVDAHVGNGVDMGGDVMYGSGYTKGAFDMVDRYMAGDWRHYYFDVQNDAVNAASLEISWESEHTSLSVFVMNPTGKIIQTNVPPGVFDYFLGWPSVDWLGRTQFSEGGGFYPVTGYPTSATSTFLNVPINGTGTYTILTHTTLFGGESITEPITLAVRFLESDLAADRMLHLNVGRGSGNSTGGYDSQAEMTGATSLVPNVGLAGAGIVGEAIKPPGEAVGTVTTPTAEAPTVGRMQATDPAAGATVQKDEREQFASHTSDSVLTTPPLTMLPLTLQQSSESDRVGAGFSDELDSDVDTVSLNPTNPAGGTETDVVASVDRTNQSTDTYVMAGIAAGAVLGVVLLLFFLHRRSSAQTHQVRIPSAGRYGAPLRR